MSKINVKEIEIDASTKKQIEAGNSLIGEIVKDRIFKPKRIII